jgi:DNA polymerase (family 10)
MDAILSAAKRTGTALEVEASADRVDLSGAELRKVLDAGVRLAIDSGARDPDQLLWGTELGVAVARRGWARRCDVLNAFSLWQCLSQLKDGRR